MDFLNIISITLGILMPYRILCNDVRREGVKASPDLVFGLFCSVPLHKIRYGIHFVLNAFYHERILAQANKSFYCALISAVIGFALFAFTAFYLMNDPVKLALIGGVSTAITGVVSGTSFYLYRCTLRQFETFHTCLARTELLLLGNSFCKQITDEQEQNTAYMNIIRNIADLTKLISSCEQKEEQSMSNSHATIATKH